MTNYREIGIVQTRSISNGSGRVVTYPHIYVVQENGSKKHYMNVPSSYMEEMLNGRPGKISEYGNIKVPASLVDVFENLMATERILSRRKKRKISLADEINRERLRVGMIPLKQIGKVAAKYNWKAA